MPVLHYKLPMVQAQHGFKQAGYGGVCWYYAAKALWKLHGASKAKTKVIHHFRQAMTAADAVRPDATMKHFKAEFIDKITTLEAIWNKISAYYPYWIQGSSQAEHVIRVQITLCVQKHKLIKMPRLPKTRLEILDAVDKIRAAIDMIAAARAITNQISDDATRAQILNAFMNDSFEQIIVREMNEAFIYKALLNIGPFYAGGYLYAEADNLVPAAGLIAGRGIVLTKKFDAPAPVDDSTHAIVVCGLSGNLVYYVDSHHSNLLRFAPAKRFIAAWAVDGTWRLIRWKACPKDASKTGGCAHTHAALLQHTP